MSMQIEGISFLCISSIVRCWKKSVEKYRFYSNMISGQKNGYKSHWQLTYNGLHCSSLQDSLSCFGRTVICNLYETWVICNSNACCKLYGLSTPPFTRKDKTHSRAKYHICGNKANTGMSRSNELQYFSVQLSVVHISMFIAGFNISLYRLVGWWKGRWCSQDGSRTEIPSKLKFKHNDVSWLFYHLSVDPEIKLFIWDSV